MGKHNYTGARHRASGGICGILALAFLATPVALLVAAEEVIRRFVI